MDKTKKITRVVVNGDSLRLYNPEDKSTQMIEKTLDFIDDKDGKIGYVGSYAFYRQSLMSYINLPGCQSVGESAFLGCSKMSNVTIPNISLVPSACFMNCYSLENVDFPYVTSLSSSAFYSCSNINNVNLPRCEIVGYNAFYQCSALTKIYLPQCRILQSSAFGGCSKLGVVDFPVLSSLFGGAFANCRMLSQVILRNSSVIQYSSPFYNTPILASSYLGYFGSIYVPASLVDSYKTATGWTSISSRITSIDNLPTE